MYPFQALSIGWAVYRLKKQTKNKGKNTMNENMETSKTDLICEEAENTLSSNESKFISDYEIMEYLYGDDFSALEDIPEEDFELLITSKTEEILQSKIANN